MTNDLLQEINKLSLAERILLVEEIWDGIAGTEAVGLPLSDAHRAELDRRLDRHDASPEDGRDWEEVQQRFLAEGK